MKKKNHLLAAAQGIASLMVVLIHCQLPGVAGQLTAALARFAVPFFFAVSGWFLVQADGNALPDRKKAAGRLKKILPVTAFTWVVYTAFSLLRYLLAGNTVSAWALEKFSPREWMLFFLFNSGKVIYDWTYVYDHLWYLFAYIYAMGILWAAAPVLAKVKRAVPACCMLLLAGLYFGELLRIYYPVRILDISIRTWYVLRNWLFTALPFMLLGIWLRNWLETEPAGEQGRIKQAAQGLPAGTNGLAFLNVLKSWKSGRNLILTGIILTVLEFLKFGSVEVYCGSLLIVTGIFVLAAAEPAKELKVFRKIGERYAASVYYWHILLLAILNWIWPGSAWHPVFVWIRPFVLYTAVILLKTILYKILRKC